MTTLDEKKPNLIGTVGHLGFGSSAVLEQEVKVTDDMSDSNDTSNPAKKLRNHLNFSGNNEHILLSCKGLAAKSKVKEFYRCEVVDGHKTFVCVWTNCHFSTKLTHKIATHINLSHIGIELKCPKSNCSKVFKNPNTYREHLKNHICGFGLFGRGSDRVLDICSNNSINKYRQKLMICGKRFYRCIFDMDGSQCGSITKYHMAMKRHIHSHICPYRKNLKLLQNRKFIGQMKSQNWDLGNTDNVSDSCRSSARHDRNSIDDRHVMTKNIYHCRRQYCAQTFSNSADLLKHEDFFCPFVHNGKLKPVLADKKIGKHMPKISSKELATCADTTPLKRKRGPRKKKVTKQNNYPEFRSSSRLLNKIMKNKQLQYVEQSVSSDSEMSVSSSQFNTNSHQSEEEANQPLNVCPSQLISSSLSQFTAESSDDSNGLKNWLKDKPILKQTIDTLIEFGINQREALNALNLDQVNDCTENNDSNQQTSNTIDDTLEEVSEEKFPFFKELFEKEMKEKEQTQNGLKCEIKELEQSIELIENVLKETIDSDVKNIIELKDALISDFLQSVQQMK